LWWLSPIFILWVNVHGGVLAGMATAAFCLLGWSAVRVPLLRSSGVAGNRDAALLVPSSGAPALPPVQLMLLLIALLAAAFVNPYGAGLPREWLETLAMPLPRLIEEHAPIDWREPVGWATAALGVGYAAVLLSTLPGRPRVVWLLPLVWLVLSFARVRIAALFAVTAVIAIGDMLPHSRFGGWLLAGQASLAAKTPLTGDDACPAGAPAQGRRGWLILPLAVVATALAIQAFGLRVPVVGRGWARFDETRWPVALLPDLGAIAAAADSPAGVPIFNDMLFGGFLIYHQQDDRFAEQPRLRVFVDDRCPLYGTDFLLAYIRASRDDPAQIERWQRQYGFRHALVESGGRFDKYLSAAPGWSLLRRCAAAALYRHR
jgi:hypothetical protein